MAEPFEIELEDSLPRLVTLPDGRRAILIESVFAGDQGPQALLILPERDGWLSAFKLERAAGNIKDEVRALERNEVWRGPRAGAVIVARDRD